MDQEILITNTENIPRKHYEIIGEVFGLTTQSKNVISNIGAGWKNLVGGEIKAYSDMLHESREKAIDRLRTEARKAGGDAVVMMRFDSGSIGGDMQSVVAYGTAVKLLDQPSHHNALPGAKVGSRLHKSQIQPRLNLAFKINKNVIPQ